MEQQKTFVDWTEDEVLQWLSKLDLGNDYSERFRGKKFTGVSLLQLNPEALDSLNITDGADRLKMIQSVTTMRADLVVSASSSRISLTRNHSEGTPPTRSRKFSEGMIKRFPNTRLRRQSNLEGTPSPSQFRKPSKLLPLDESESDSRRQIESMLTLRTHNKKYLSRSMDGLLMDGLLKERPGPQIICTESGSARLVEVLKQENDSLKKELDTYYQKVRKLMKLEQEVEHVHDSYRLLESSGLKREKLEAAVRAHLEEEVKRLRENQLPVSTSAGEASPPKKKAGVKKEIARRNTMIMKLIKQNNDQVVYREQLEKDLVSAKAALQARIGQNVVSTPNSGHLDTELNRYSIQYAESIDKLKSVLEAMQNSSQKRENLEKRLRQQLEAEVKRLKTEAKGQKAATEDQPNIRVSALESDVARWEQKCLELVAEKQMALEAAIIPRDSRIAQLERELAHKCDLTEELKRQKAHYIAQIQEVNKALSETEVRCTSMQAALAEKDSVIQLLQQSFLEPDNSPPDDSLLASLDSPGLEKKLTYSSHSRSSSQHSLTSNSSKSSGDMLDHFPTPTSAKRKASHEVASGPEYEGAAGRMSSPAPSHVKKPPTPPPLPFVHTSNPLVEATPKQCMSLPAIVYSDVGSGHGLPSGSPPTLLPSHKIKPKSPSTPHVSAAWENMEHEGVANELGTTHVHHTSSVEFIKSLFDDRPEGSTVSQPAGFEHIYSHAVSACPVMM